RRAPWRAVRERRQGGRWLRGAGAPAHRREPPAARRPRTGPAGAPTPRSYARTAGGIGALMRLLRQGANHAIRSGEEKLSVKGLNYVRLAEGPTSYWERVKATLASFVDDPVALRVLL